MVCIRDELMISTVHGHILRYRWDGSLNRDYCLDLRRIPFCIDKQVSKGCIACHYCNVVLYLISNVFSFFHTFLQHYQFLNKINLLVILIIHLWLVVSLWS